MKYESELKERAMKLRHMGLSYGEIKAKIPIAKSTLSLWLKNVKLSYRQKQRLYTKQIRILSLGPKSQRERRESEVECIINDATKTINLPISDDSYRLFGAALYWAEGSKNGMCQITNSDPHLILFFVRWAEKIFGVPASDLHARLNIYDKQSEFSIKKFWSDLTGIPLRNFGKSYIKPSGAGYRKNKLYYGTMRIEIPKSVNMKHQIYGWIKAALQDIEPGIKITQNKWVARSKMEYLKPINL